MTTGLTDFGMQELLLRPFGDGRPAGRDLRTDVSPQSIYFRLRDARAEARAAERLADNDPALGGAPPPPWTVVHDLATEALSSHSKDIEIACWLTESLTRKQGLGGLADGVAVVVGLIERFWDAGLFPSAEADDPEGQLVAVTGMSGQDRDGSLLQPLRKTVLFARSDGTPVTFWEFERSREFAALGAGAEKAQRAAASVVPFSGLEAEARGHGRASLLALKRDVARAVAAWQAMEAATARVAAGDAVPATGRVRSLLDSFQRLARRYVPDDEAAPAEPEGAGTGAEPPPAADGAAEGPDVPKRHAMAPDRDAMLDDIVRIAAAFRRAEPNSPLSFTLEEAVRRARLPWPELLRELTPDTAVRSMLLTGVGMKATPE